MRRLLLLATMWLASTSLAGGAGAQGHPVFLGQGRPLQERVALAEAIAVVDVVAQEPGRLEAELRETLLGTLPPRFTVKRARSTPPPLAAGDRALLLLRGARAPFVLVDRPGETIRLTSEQAAARWKDAVAGVVAARGDPEQLAALMLGWIDQGPPALRDTGFASLQPLLATSPALHHRVAVDRAEAAGDPERGPEVRAASARLAVSSPEGARRLVLVLAADAPLEPTALSLALRAGALRGHPELGSLFQRALASDRADLRRLAVAQPAVVARLGEAALKQVERLASEDPDPDVRRAATETVGRLHRSRSSSSRGARRDQPT